MAIIKTLIRTIDRFISIFHPILPNAYDNFAFKDEQERQRYYDQYGTIPNRPDQPFTLKRFFTVIIQGIALFIALFLAIVFSGLLVNYFS